MKTIIFDFDNTLTTYDTVFPFLYFANVDMKLMKFAKKCICSLYRASYRLKLISNYQLKNMAVKLFIYNYSEEQIRQASKAFFKKLNFHEDVFIYLQRYLHQEDTKVYISTASFSDYVDLLKQTFPDLIIQASLLNYHGGKVKGLRHNNYGNDKRKCWGNVSINVLFTDSLSDLPLAEKAEHIKFVTKKGEIQTCSNLSEFIQYCKQG